MQLSKEVELKDNSLLSCGSGVRVASGSHHNISVNRGFQRFLKNRPYSKITPFLPLLQHNVFQMFSKEPPHGYF